MSRETELLEAILLNQQEILIAMTLTSDAIAAQTTAVTALTAAVAAIPNDSASDDATNAAAIEANTTAIQAATSQLGSDVTPPVTLALPAQTVDAPVGSALNSSISAGGGTPPYTFTATGLPDGVTLSTEGVLTGTAPAAGTYPITVEVNDSATPPASATGTVTLTTA